LTFDLTISSVRITPGPPIHFYQLLEGTDCGRFILNEESGVEELREEIADLRREVYQQRTCLIFVLIFVTFLLIISFFVIDPVLVVIITGLILVIGAYFLERRGL